MVMAANLGFPRIGAKRALKRMLEAHWRGELDEAGLVAQAKELRLKHWRIQVEAGLDVVPSGDFSLYDHVLDTAVLFGVVPERYGRQADLSTYFAMARGDGRRGLPALEMTKWFDTNYHYIVPDLAGVRDFQLGEDPALAHFLEAKAAGIDTRPVLLGPVTFLALAKGGEGLLLLDRLLPVYAERLRRFAAAGATAVQLDEPWLPLVRTDEGRQAYRRAYEVLREAAGGLRLLLASYFTDLGGNLDLARSLPVDALHLDLSRGGKDLTALLALGVPQHLGLSLGLVDGRNVWRTDLGKALDLAEEAAAKVGQARLEIAPSCSLLYVPMDLAAERSLEPEVRAVLAFARQKLDELVLLREGIAKGRDAIASALAEVAAQRTAWQASPRRRDPGVQARLAALRPEDFGRPSPYAVRRRAQAEALPRPLLPTTTIGSYPQTEEVRRTRALFRRGELSLEAYEEAMRAEITKVVRLQEEIGLDVLVHGEPERNDMVEYFAEQMEGFLRTEEGWVQSYGSRCVKPPILFGDVRRKGPMTVRWARHAQSVTEKPVKGMLTGPVTILKWSFVRDDQPLSDTAMQVALALRDEVLDLEAAGMKVIQIDEPAYREAAPLAPEERDAYFTWASRAFRLVTGGVKDATQIHSHMCYSEFNDILHWIAALDADVLLIEASRSGMELLPAFAEFQYPNEVGPGVYDIHSPRVPTVTEMAALIRKAVAVLPADRIWVNPDCGLKTRRYEEVIPSLQNMVAAAKLVRAELEAK